jgi:hypothetical protein
MESRDADRSRITLRDHVDAVTAGRRSSSPIRFVMLTDRINPSAIRPSPPVERRDLVSANAEFCQWMAQGVSVDSAEMCQYCQGSNQRPKITSLLGR